MKKLDIYISHSNKIDYKHKLYEPINNSKIAKENNLILPLSNEFRDIDTKDILINSDLLIAEITVPAIGVGIEIGRAQVSGVKVLCLLKKGEKCSSSVRRICEDIIEYIDEKDMIYKLNNYLKQNF